MIDPEKFRHDRSLYERPRFPYQCGRGALWSRPCWQGPKLDGKCGGETQCNPVQKGDRWECRRPTRGGGPCAHGPLPNGHCASMRPPCIPRVTLRRWRGRVTLLCVGVVVTLIATFANFSGGSLASIDPGPLSTIHQGFTQDGGCSVCHASHDLQGLAWFTATFLHQDNTGRCLQCHGFGGRDRSAHNATFGNRAEMDNIECTSCHSEHQGADFEPSRVDNVTCNNCHRSQIESFHDGHPGYVENFPYQVSNSIYFDHTRHISEYFSESRWTAAANRDAGFAAEAKKSCTACHEVEAATREVKPSGYDKICARCHQHQIQDRELVLYAPDEHYALTGLLFGSGEDDEDLDERKAELLDALLLNSVDVFVETLAGEDAPARAQALFGGLNPIAVRQSAVAWLEDAEYEPEIVTETRLTGWNTGEDAAGGQSIHYRASGHSDPLIRAWIEYAVHSRQHATDAKASNIADAALAYLLDDDDGPGSCGKCHASGVLTSAANEPVQWLYRGSVPRPHTAYSHAPHINLLGPDVSCKTCHILDQKADYGLFFEDLGSADSEFQSNFVSIRKETCDQCHKPGIVRFDCQLCHTYHRNPGFKVGFQERRVVHE